MSVKHIPIAEFRELGFLQEANRLFFHPHGLALEITRVTDEENAPIYSFALGAKEYAELTELLEIASDRLREGVAKAIRNDVGDCWISGCWDYREDPEGVWFDIASWERETPGSSQDFAEKAAHVAGQREHHRAAREAMLGGASDIEAIPAEEGPADA